MDQKTTAAKAITAFLTTLVSVAALFYPPIQQFIPAGVLEYVGPILASLLVGYMTYTIPNKTKE